MIALVFLAADTGLEQVEVYAPPILGCVFGLPILAVMAWFFLRFTYPDRPTSKDEGEGE